MAVCCATYKLLFIGNTRTGSTAISEALIENCGGCFLPEKRFFVGNEVITKKHSTLDQLIRHRLLDWDPSTLYKFVAIRNPYDSLVSLYLKNRYRENRAHERCQLEKLSFKDFISYKFRNRPPRSMHARFVEGADRIIRFESLQEDLSAVLAHVGAPNFKLPVVNRTEVKHTHYSKYYDAETREWVGKVFAPDFNRFGYEFEDSPSLPL